MGKPVRIRYFAGPATWALARDAYLGGESAPSIARRLGLSVNGIRKRAARHGWTRTQHAEALSRQRRPDQVLSDMLAQIIPALREGRYEQAADLARAAERLTRVADAAERLLPPTPWEENEARKAAEAEAKAREERFQQAVWERARSLAEAMLAEETHGVAAAWSHAAYHWRARTLGREIAASDFAAAVSGGWASHYWDGRGRLKPLAQPRPPGDGYMIGQFLQQTGQAENKMTADLTRFPWPPPEPAQPEAAEPEASAAEPAGKPKLSFEERVRLASGKSGPESRPKVWG